MPREGFVVGIASGRTSRADAAGADPAAMRASLETFDLAWANLEVDDLADAARAASALGFSPTLVTELLKEKGSAYIDLDQELAVLSPMIRVEKMAVTVEPLILLVRPGVVATMYRSGRSTRFQKFARYAEAVLRKIPENASMPDKLTALVTRLLNESNERNFDGIRAIEDEGEKLQGELVREDVDRKKLAKDIYQMKRALIRYLDALWDSVDVMNELRHGDAELVSDDPAILARVALLADDVQRHIQLSEHMSEVLSSGLEVTQSIYNNQLQVLNNRMAFIVAWLTILGTAVLVPNTLATILASAPDSLRVHDPTLYLAIMIGSTVLATFAAWLWIKLKIPLPRKLD